MKYLTTAALVVLAFVAKAQVAQIVSTAGDKLSSATLTVEFTVGDIAVGDFEGFEAANYGISLITGLESETLFQFYPNPAQKFLTIEADLATGSTFRVTDISGRNFDLPTELTTHRVVVDVSTLPSSLYVLTIQENNGLIHRVKFIKAL